MNKNNKMSRNISLQKVSMVMLMKSKIIKAVKNPQKAISFLISFIEREIFLIEREAINFFIDKIYNPFIDVKNKFRRADFVGEAPKNLSPPALKGFNEIKEYSSKKRTDISDHLITLFVESIKIKPKVIVELGVRGGESTFALERVAKICNAKLISVDIVDCSKVSSYEDWIFVKSDDIEFATQFEKWCQERGIEPKIDVLFIDTSHLYEHTLQEIKYWFPFLSSKSKVFFHDTNRKGVYFRKDRSMALPWDTFLLSKLKALPDTDLRGVIRALEKFFNKSFNENKSFMDFGKGFLIKHYPLCLGFTILEKAKKNNEQKQ